MYVVYTPLLRKTRSDSVTAGLRNGIVIKNGVRKYVAYVVMRAALMQITSCHYGYGMLCRLAPSSTTSARRLLGTTCRMPFSLMFAVCGPASMGLGRSRLGTTARSRGGFAVPIGTQPA